jgi:putative flippase GtrA
LSGWRLQSLRFGIVGLVSNIVLYLLYLLFTGVGSGHKTTMTILFVIGTIQTFIFNKRWTFGYQELKKSIFPRYVMIYSGAYLTNFVALVLFVDYLSFPHEIVQGIMIPLVAVLVFMLQRYWVFRKLNPMMIAK